MKTTLLIICSILLVQLSNAQFSRSFFPFENITSFNRNLTVFNEGKYYLITPSNISTSEELIIKIGEIDALGDLGHVDEYNLNLGFIGGGSKVASAIFNADGSLSMAIFTQCTGKNKLTFVRVQGGLVLQQFNISNSELYFDNSPTVKIKGSSFVSYLTTNLGVYKRLEVSTLNFENYSEEVVDTHNYSFIGACYRFLDFEIDGVNEYIIIKNKGVFKRNDVNNYTVSPFELLSVSYICKIRKLNNELFVFYKNLAYKFDLNLNFIAEIVIDPNLVVSSFYHSYLEVIPKDNGFLYVCTLPNNGETNFQYYQLNSSLGIDDSVSMKKMWRISSLQSIDDHIVINGFSLQKSYFTNFSNQIDYELRCSYLGVFKDFHKLSFSDDFYQELGTENLKLNTSVGSEFFGARLVEATFDYKVNTTGKESSMLYSASTKIIGKNEDGETVGRNNQEHFNSGWSFPGPYTDSIYVNDSLFSKYSRPYYVTRQMIVEHLQYIQWGSPNYIVPHGIREWPAHGNVSHGQSENLAKFIDANNNGIYEPYLGDYPAIYGDECVLTIQNKHDNATGMKLEWMNYIYFFNCEENKEPVVFVNTEYTNIGGQINETYFTNYSNFDLGNYSDDYMGTHVDLGMVYGYNGDNFDEDNIGLFGFGEVIPSIGMQLLKGAKLDDDLIDNVLGVSPTQSINGIGFGDDEIDNEFYTLESSYRITDSYPNSSEEFFNVSKGIYPNGSPQLANGVPVNYSFIGNSDPQFYASGGVDHGNDDFEVGSNMMPGDRRILGSSGPFTFEQGESRSFLQAYLIAVDTVNPSPINSVNKLTEYATVLKQEYAMNETECGNNFNEIQEDLGIVKVDASDILIYPNPFQETLTVTGLDEVGGTLSVYNMEGKILLSQNINSGEVKIEMSTLKTGVYFIKIENGANNYLKKVVKM
jgi:hypothetical protein